MTTYVAILLYLDLKIKFWHVCMFMLYIFAVNIVFLKCIICSLKNEVNIICLFCTTFIASKCCIVLLVKVL